MRAVFAWPAGVELRDQGDGDLGQRMARAVEEGVQQGIPVLLIGTDCPQLTAQLLRQAAEALSNHDSVLFPASDGGYVLLGLRHSHPRVFAEITWSSASVASSTRFIACCRRSSTDSRAGMIVHLAFCFTQPGTGCP